jgi:hypothetical protein
MESQSTSVSLFLLKTFSGLPQDFHETILYKDNITYFKGFLDRLNDIINYYFWHILNTPYMASIKKDSFNTTLITLNMPQNHAIMIITQHNIL